MLVSVSWPSVQKGHTLELAAVLGDRIIPRDPALASAHGNVRKGEVIATEPGMTLFDGAENLVSCPLADPSLMLTLAVPDVTQ